MQGPGQGNAVASDTGLAAENPAGHQWRACAGVTSLAWTDHGATPDTTVAVSTKFLVSVSCSVSLASWYWGRVLYTAKGTDARAS
jgi:hypothetical protein